MIDLSFWFGVLVSTAGITGGGLGVASFVREINQSRKAETQQTDQAELARRQTDALERQADAQEATAVLPDETAMQGWTRTLLNTRLKVTRDKFHKELEDEVKDLKAIIGTSVTASQYVTTQGNVLEIITRAEQAVVNGNLMIAEEERIKFAAEHALSEIQSVIRAISNFEQQRLNPDEIERRILTAIGESLLHMAKTPVPPSFPVRDYGITTRDTEEEQING